MSKSQEENNFKPTIDSQDKIKGSGNPEPLPNSNNTYL